MLLTWRINASPQSIPGTLTSNILRLFRIGLKATYCYSVGSHPPPITRMPWRTAWPDTALPSYGLHHGTNASRLCRRLNCCTLDKAQGARCLTSIGECQVSVLNKKGIFPTSLDKEERTVLDLTFQIGYDQYDT